MNGDEPITPEVIEAGAKAVEASGTTKLKLPLRGMPFKLDDLKRATRHAMDAARRAGKAIKWQEARKRGYLWLVMMHFPSPYGIQRSL